jgi:two-component system sensor histidine kinase FlrB
LSYRSLDPRLQQNVYVAKQEGAQSDWMLGNPDTLAGALGNLAANAVESGADRVEIGARNRAAGYVDIYVKDNGPGVAPDIAEKIFDPFFTTRAGGTGLGLAVVRSEAESMGGSVLVEDNVSGGATFVIRVPAAEVAQQDIYLGEVMEASA